MVRIVGDCLFGCLILVYYLLLLQFSIVTCICSFFWPNPVAISLFLFAGNELLKGLPLALMVTGKSHYLDLFGLRVLCGCDVR